MKWIRNWGDLKEFGIEMITSGACGLSYRLLFDLTSKGKQIIEKSFGGMKINCAEPWNCGCKDDPHIGSILLPPEMFVPLGAFALLESGCTDVWKVDEMLIGFEPEDSDRQRSEYESLYGPRRTRKFHYIWQSQ